MIKTDTFHELFDSSVRASSIVHIRSMLVGNPASEVWELFESDIDDICDAMGVELPEYVANNKWDICYFLISCKEAQGLLVKFDTPVPRDLQVNGSYSSGWNRYYSKWFFANTMQDACEKALAWQEKVVQEAYKDAGVNYR